MSKEKDRQRGESPPQNYGNNGHWDFKKAVDEETTCATCGFGGGPFVLQGPRAAQGIPIAPAFVCQNLSSECYMGIKVGLGSCRCYKPKQATDQPSIIVARKPVPPIKLGDLKGGKG